MRSNGCGGTRSGSTWPAGAVSGFFDAALAVLVAPLCAVCQLPLDTPLAGAVCEACWSAVSRLSEPLCQVCGDALLSWRTDDASERLCGRCANRRRVITIGRSIGSYEGTLRDILHALKYGRRRSVAPVLARLMSDAGGIVLAGADYLVPVPLHFIRQYRRGFNQAAELARAIEVPMLNALRRVRSTATQTDLPEAQRHRNVQGAFSVRRAARCRIKGAIIVLIDDVSTTGATLDACANVLLAEGAKEVRALTAARAASRLQ